MIKYDFKTYTRNYFTEEEYNEVLFKKIDIINKLKIGDTKNEKRKRHDESM